MNKSMKEQRFKWCTGSEKWLAVTNVWSRKEKAGKEPCGPGMSVKSFKCLTKDVRSYLADSRKLLEVFNQRRT